MRTITFTAEDRKALAHDRSHHPDPRVPRTREVLWLKRHGLTHDPIAASADVSRSAVQRDLDQYLEGGRPRLRRCQGNHPQSALDEHEVCLEEYFRKHPPRSAKQAQAVIEQRTGLRRGLSPVRHFLKDHLGLRGARPGPSPYPRRRRSRRTARAGRLPAGAVGAAPGGGPSGPEAGVLCGRRALRLRAVPGLLVVRGAAVRAGGLGPQTLQGPGGSTR